MDFKELYKSYLRKLDSLKLRRTNHVILASIKNQKLFLIKDNQIVNEFRMSTSKNKPSCINASLGTPWGLHEICEKIGDNEPFGMVFVGRKATGKIFSECTAEKQLGNLITTRILRLKGLEPGINSGGSVDSFDRYIYIHGTNHEERLGLPASSGCLQMSNDDIIEIYNVILENTHIWIENPFV